MNKLESAEMADDKGLPLSDLFLPCPYFYDQYQQQAVAAAHTGPFLQTAAVLILLRECNNNGFQKGPSNKGDKRRCWSVLLTVRSQKMRRHPGEVCFPGGMRDLQMDRTPADTALREAYEEIGLPPSFVRVLGTLQPMVSLHHIRIFPVLARLVDVSAGINANKGMPSFEPFFNSDEVESHFWAPLDRFLAKQGHQSFTVPDTRFRMHLFTFDGHQVFGITAILCIVVALGVLRQLPAFPVMDENMGNRDTGKNENAVGTQLCAIFNHFGQVRSFVEPKNILAALPSKL